MIQLTTPGVYVQQIAGGARPIQGTGTSTFGVVGCAPKRDAHVNTAFRVINWLQFRREFVDGDDGEPVGESTHMVEAVKGFFSNGGGACYVVNTGSPDGSVPGDIGTRVGVDALSLVDEVAIVAAPGYTDSVSFKRVVDHCEFHGDRVAILDGPASFATISELVEGTKPEPPKIARKTEEPIDDDDKEAAPSPPSPPAPGAGYRPPDPSPRGFGAQYGPWIGVSGALNGEYTLVPPSGHIAGIYARTDFERGVHKTPAGIGANLRGVTGLAYQFTDNEQGYLNPKGFNAIRFFPGVGHVVWGGRTIASDPEWRYLSVLRLFLMIEESILQGTAWVVFEPNDERLWAAIRRDVTAFLNRLWRSGALFGSTADEAFFVQCDESTNPPEDRDQGIVTALIGIAPVKPAEFMVFKISQQDAGAAQPQGGSNA